MTREEKEYLDLFFNRNADYIKHSDVPQSLINKYTGVLPEALIEVWKRTGFGIYEHGFIQFVDPEEWDFVLEYINMINDPVIVFAITALGDILTWEGIGYLGQGNHINMIYVNDGDEDVQSGDDIFFWLGEDFDCNNKDESNINFSSYEKSYRSKNYNKIKKVLPPLKYGQCYGYVPIPALGGKKSYKNLQIVDAKVYVDLIGQTVGKIID
ncbi:GAD-like domain-containing protein [Capnocytophaga gingivalis]|mgnify:CR=1 FL=1|uniref:GAD-like domain-containing protein n=1 Tax=Capnocytophaga gingivalis TaxID=1017 RepID=UPI0023531911|nr:GAD-like domain-containing protein [Capnocytophaga gingivalis]